MHVLKQVYAKAARELIPLSVHFDLTYRCHQHCLHCYLPAAWRRGEGPEPELTTNQVKDILDQLAAAGTFFLTFSGGEIFLRQDLLDLLEYARRLNFTISLFTSGTVGLDQEKIRFLGELGIGSILLSLYSMDSRIHDEITRNPGSWQRVQKVTEYCLSNNILTIFNSVILKPNFKELAALKDFGEKNKLEIRLDYDLAPPWDGTHHREGLALDQKEKDSINDYLNKKYCFKEQYNQDTGKTDLFEPINCGTGMKQCYISPAGEVRPCIDIHRPCGRLGAGSNFQDLWRESKELNEIRNLIASTNGSDKPLCKILKSNKDNSNF